MGDDGWVTMGGSRLKKSHQKDAPLARNIMTQLVRRWRPMQLYTVDHLDLHVVFEKRLRPLLERRTWLPLPVEAPTDAAFTSTSMNTPVAIANTMLRSSFAFSPVNQAVLSRVKFDQEP